MNSLLERAARFVKTKLDNDVAVLVEYHRATHAIEGLKAIPGRTDFEQYSIDDTIGTSKAFDWIVSEQDLIIESRKTQPQKNDYVVYRMRDGRVAYYIVVADANDRCFSVVDQLGILYRVHTKLDRIESGQ